MSQMVKWQRVGLFLLDALLVAVAVWLGYLLRFNFHIPEVLFNYRRQMLMAVLLIVPLRLLLFYFFYLYQGILRYAGTTELVAIFSSTSLGSLILVAIDAFLIPHVPAILDLPSENRYLLRIPLVTLIVEWAMTLLLIGGSRFSRRLLIAGLLNRGKPPELRRVLVVGAGDTGEAVARQMIQAPVRAYQPVAFVDDDPNKRHRRIHGIPVAGSTSDLPELIEKYQADEVLVARRGMTPAALREIVTLCEHARVGFKLLPSVQDVLSGRVSINQIRPVEIEDLLGREEIQLELPAERNYIRGEIVMITGAGGSIGSELCRQLLRFEPEKIVLYGHGENSIYEIAMELNAAGHQARLVPVIGDVRDAKKLAAVTQAYRPTIFFHAAAHKHVPLMEAHPDEAIKNNVTGTMNVAKAAEAVGAKRFLLISSDKAVRPTNVMGASKRLAEMIIFCLAKTSRTQFVAVRFGNVLGSRGSVIPLFKKQIARGGPVTLTHPDVVRFFMTIPEAVSLVIQAGSMNEQRRLYLLDMGAPVKIVDLARNLIRLSGFDPDRDIEVKFTGLRPGEKLKEELLTAAENVVATGMGKIFITQPDDIDCTQLWENIKNLEALAAETNPEGIKELLHHLVPDYGPEKNLD